MALTFFLAVIGWIIFRAEDMSQAFNFIFAMFSNKFFDVSQLHGITYSCLGLLLLTVEWFQRDRQHALQYPNIRVFRYHFVRWGIYYFILIIIFTYSGTNQTFIYFQF